MSDESEGVRNQLEETGRIQHNRQMKHDLFCSPADSPLL